MTVLAKALARLRDIILAPRPVSGAVPLYALMARPAPAEQRRPMHR